GLERSRAECRRRHAGAEPAKAVHHRTRQFPLEQVEGEPAANILFRAKKFNVTYHMGYSSSRSMRTCKYISTVIWPTMSVAKATRHSRLSQGCVFSLGLSRSYKGQAPEANSDNPEVSR